MESPKPLPPVWNCGNRRPDKGLEYVFRKMSRNADPVVAEINHRLII
jgi:hypothetical protein